MIATTKNIPVGAIRRVWVGFMVTLLSLLAACSSESAESASEVVDVVDELPLVVVTEDEAGPSDIAGYVDASSAILEARLVEVRPAIRFYGPDVEAPDALAFEQVALVFEPTTVYKGEVGPQIELRWTSYVTDGTSPDATRLERVEINGIIVNENAVGQRYGLFVGESVGDGIFDPLTSAGIVPLNPAGHIQGRHSSSAFLYGDFIGGLFSDIIEGNGNNGNGNNGNGNNGNGN